MSPTQPSEQNPPAFPNGPCDQAGQPKIEASEGMTLRDYFAAKALQALVGRWNEGTKTHAQITTQQAYEYADAMLIARLHLPPEESKK